jgi:hypothetical protein
MCGYARDSRGQEWEVHEARAERAEVDDARWSGEADPLGGGLAAPVEHKQVVAGDAVALPRVAGVGLPMEGEVVDGLKQAGLQPEHASVLTRRQPALEQQFVGPRRRAVVQHPGLFPRRAACPRRTVSRR